LAQAQFSQLGAVVQIAQIDESSLEEALRSGDINMMSVAIPGSDPVVLEQLFPEERAAMEATPVSTTSTDLAALLRNGATATSDHKRAENYARAQALIMDEALIVPVALWPENVVVAAEIAGVRRDFRNGLWLHDAIARDSGSEP
jgi:peptide/nickel transport system substrate-binding protein